MTRQILYLLLFIAVLTTTAAGQAEIKLKYDELEFGWVPHNSTVMQHCLFKSVGKDTLIINDVVSSCKCLVVALERQILPPGDSLFVPIYWESGEVANNHSHYAIIITNAPLVGTTRNPMVKIKGITVLNPETLMPVAISPYKMELSRLDNISVDSISFTLENRSERDFEILINDIRPEQFEISVPNLIRAKSTGTGYVRVNPEFLDKEFSSSITLSLKGDQRYLKNISIPIKRKIYSN